MRDGSFRLVLAKIIALSIFVIEMDRCHAEDTMTIVEATYVILQGR